MSRPSGRRAWPDGAALNIIIGRGGAFPELGQPPDLKQQVFRAEAAGRRVPSQEYGVHTTALRPSGEFHSIFAQSS